jgi:hypothetical protein
VALSRVDSFDLIFRVLNTLNLLELLEQKWYKSTNTSGLRADECVQRRPHFPATHFFFVLALNLLELLEQTYKY